MCRKTRDVEGAGDKGEEEHAKAFNGVERYRWVLTAQIEGLVA